MFKHIYSVYFFILFLQVQSSPVSLWFWVSIAFGCEHGRLSEDKL